MDDWQIMKLVARQGGGYHIDVNWSGCKMSAGIRSGLPIPARNSWSIRDVDAIFEKPRVDGGAMPRFDGDPDWSVHVLATLPHDTTWRSTDEVYRHQYAALCEAVSSIAFALDHGVRAEWREDAPSVTPEKAPSGTVVTLGGRALYVRWAIGVSDTDHRDFAVVGWRVADGATMLLRLLARSLSRSKKGVDSFPALARSLGFKAEDL